MCSTLSFIYYCVSLTPLILLTSPHACFIIFYLTEINLFFLSKYLLIRLFSSFIFFFFSILVLKHHTELETDLRSALQRSDISIIKLLISWSY